MKSISVKLENQKTVNDFVKVTQSYACEILVKSGKYVVDAKSILGIFSLDLTKPVTVEVYSDDCTELLDQLAAFKA